MKERFIFSVSIEDKALDQFFDAMRQEPVIKGALMPDAHAGYSLPIGAVVAVKDMVFPSYVGYDIGCGMCAVPTTFTRDQIKANAKAIFDAIYRLVPVGFNHNSSQPAWLGLRTIPRTEVVYNHLASKGAGDLYSLGGGNHFIEIGYSETDEVWIILHSGSRNLGHSVAKHYMGVASGDGRPREGHYGLNVDDRNGMDYITDMNFCLEYALENRLGIIRRVTQAIRTTGLDGNIDHDRLINRNHNHAELEWVSVKDSRDVHAWIHRKGATHARDGMMGVIPGNMRDGSFIVRGKGNPDSLYSSSHGAGRVLGRTEAMNKLDLETFIREMSDRGIQARVGEDTLDEAAGAYKDIFEVMAMQHSLVDVIHHIVPLINIKG